MNNDRIENLLLQLLQDVAEIKSKVNTLDEQNLTGRIDTVQAQVKEQERIIKYLEKRADNMEEFITNELTEKNKSNKSIWISIGIAFFTAGISFIMNLL